MIFDARGNGEGNISPTITGDHQNRITDYTAIVIEYEESSRTGLVQSIRGMGDRLHAEDSRGGRLSPKGISDR